jgi:hypothetical protein
MLDKLITILVNLWIYDLEVLTKPWVLYTIIPAILYVCLMLCKWLIITIPVWLPFAMIIDAFGGKKPKENSKRFEASIEHQTDVTTGGKCPFGFSGNAENTNPKHIEEKRDGAVQ